MTETEHSPNSVSARSATLQDVVLDVALPQWPLPMSLQVNPVIEEAVQRHHAWLYEHGLADQLIKVGAGRVAAHAYPRADIDTLCLASDWTAWYLHFDDYFDESPLGGSAVLARTTVDSMRDLLGHPHQPPPVDYRMPLERTRNAFGDLLARTCEVMTPLQYRIFTSHLEAYFDSLVTEADNRERHAVLQIDDYCALRRNTGPCLPLVDLVELAESIRLPQTFYASPLFEQLLNTTADITSWINDVFSAVKELEQGDNHNLILVIQRAARTSLAEATRLAIAHISDHLRLLDSAQGELAAQRETGLITPTGHDAIERWIGGLRALLHHSDWYIQNQRYDRSEVAK
jgi:hypothetical protein